MMTPRYHVILKYRPQKQGSDGETFTLTNLDADALKADVVGAWREGTRIFWRGNMVDPRLCEKVQILETLAAIPLGMSWKKAKVIMSMRDVTDEWITGPAGVGSAQRESADGGRSARDRADEDRTQVTVQDSIFAGAVGVYVDNRATRDNGRRVMVVHGRNTRARNAMFNFLRSLGLQPIEWDDAVRETGAGTPHNLEAVRAAMKVAAAVVVVMTAEDQAGLLPEFAGGGQDDAVLLRGQPRQNVMLEAGMAIATDPEKTIIVQLGPIRVASDLDGLNVVRLDDTPAQRSSLRSRLRTAGCDLQDDSASSDWLSADTGGAFEAAAVSWSPREPSA